MLPVIVVGASLAGMAAAARLAKAGHRVVLYEASDRLGGRAAPYALADGTRVDDLPGVIGFPAPVRDLFRKSGRVLEAELARTKAALVPAASSELVFADGTLLSWPSDRGEQYEALVRTFGATAAARWRDLLDSLDDVWQVVRRLGLERELPARRSLPLPVRQALLARRSVADLAAELRHPQLGALLRSTAYRLGSRPERTPAFAATAAALERTFGRWRIAAPGERDGLTSVLTEALAGRLATRRVEIRLGEPVERIVVEGGRIVGVGTSAGVVPAAAVVAGVDPWRLVDDLLPPATARRTRRGVHRLSPAWAPSVSHRSDGPAGADTESVELDADGCPRLTWTRPSGLVSVHDHRRTHPDSGAGSAWHGFADWWRRPPVSTEIGGLFSAGPASPGGAGFSAVLLSGALASYGVHDLLG